MNEPVAYSSLKLLFGKCDYWFLNANSEWESSGLPDISYFQKDESKRVAQSLFWRNLSSKIYQFDNFNYDGIASIQFEKQVSKFKINFNPILFYEYVMYSVAVDLGIKLPEWVDGIFDLIIPILNQNKNDLSTYGWDFDFYESLRSKQWTEESWKNWNNLVHKNQYIFDCVIFIFIHEMMHLMWDHVNRMKKSDDPLLFNKAADFAINQSLSFPMPLKKRLVTQFSTFFWPDAQFAFMTYFYKNGYRIPKHIKNILTDKSTFEEHKNNSEINDFLDFNNNELINNKNADFYFNILKEAGEDSQTPSGSSGNNGTPFFKHPAADSGNAEGEGDQQEKNEDSDNDFSGFAQQLEKMLVGKMFRESYEKSEDAKMERGERGQSEIPFSMSIQEKIDEFVKVKKDNRWKKELKNFLMNYMNAKEKDITMTRSNRKRPEIFPGMRMEIGLDVIFIIDTSGSIRKQDYKQFVGEITNVSKMCDMQKCRIIQCHTSVSSDDKKFSLKKIKSIVFKDTGGTRMRTALELLVREGNKKPVVIFTDGFIDYFTAEEFKFKILMFVTSASIVENIKKKGFKVICPKDS